ncbi:MAG: RDD family protein [Ignavibacteriaceae bacterium]|nr:RDD family protein [Ignavibacteriaceae bacterium]
MVELKKREQGEKPLLILEQHTLKTIKDRFSLDEPVLDTEWHPISDVKQSRPWVRFWARMIDIIVVSIFVSLFVGLFIPHGLGWELFSIFIRIISAILLEGYLLSTWGMTLGKSLLQVYVRDSQGRKLRFSQAIKRCISAWAWGLGFGIPIVSLIFAYLSYEHLQETGVAKWDSEGGSLVSHNKIGIPRLAVVVCLFIGLIWFELVLLLR